ncbi:Hemin transport protein [Lysobacter sp. N42]|uniref:Hemin transport protein n=1 Tax=Lysobacter sp. N42 TaxID=2545719 RepID=UPI001044B114|nr:Hemin transport protein [Lysobacter sp. N42]TCZ80486.1 Hemin transport protein [Lysobacter sp. N42]
MRPILPAVEPGAVLFPKSRLHRARRPLAPPRTRLPQAAQLAALGAVLCLYPVEPGGQLAGWARAVGCAVGAVTDNDGPREWIDFLDAAGRRCWRLHRLPDSDAAAWARLAAGLPAAADPAGEGLLARLWQGAITALREPPRAADVVRLHAAGDGALGASLVRVSDFGAGIAAQLARREGAVNAAHLRERCSACVEACRRGH